MVKFYIQSGTGEKLREGHIKVSPADTKTFEGGLVPLNQELLEMVRVCPAVCLTSLCPSTRGNQLQG